MTNIFVDGQAGTTGLQITARLQAAQQFELLTLSDDERKDPAHRAAALQAADVAILCLPDAAAREAVTLAGEDTRIIDASTAHRLAPEWVYGLPELNADQRDAIASARLVANPGCYPQGFILLTKPLIDAGLLAADSAMHCNAVSGYSGGGRSMIEDHTAYDAEQAEALNTQAYGLALQHKHVPEMQAFSGLTRAPVFAPSVAHYYQGMLVQVPLHASQLQTGTSAEDVVAALTAAYADAQFVDVVSADPERHAAVVAHGFLNPTACNDTNRMELFIFHHAQQLLLCARYDNLGKGAAGAAMQNLNIMLGLQENLGL
ncbi:MAG: N-acetyl-gamma-glutamyl-phosphate reductase [Pseudomonadota bacterium]